MATAHDAEFERAVATHFEPLCTELQLAIVARESAWPEAFAEARGPGLRLRLESDHHILSLAVAAPSGSERFWHVDSFAMLLGHPDRTGLGGRLRLSLEAQKQFVRANTARIAGLLAPRDLAATEARLRALT